MDLGRVHCFLVSTRQGEVVYERFYDRLNEVEKAEVRAAFHTASTNVTLTIDDDFVGAYK